MYYDDKIDKCKNTDNYQVAWQMRQFLKKILVRYPNLRTVLYTAGFEWQFINTYLYYYVGDNVLSSSAEDLDSLATGHYGKKKWNAMEDGLVDYFKEIVQTNNAHLSTRDSMFDAQVTALLAVSVLSDTVL